MQRPASLDFYATAERGFDANMPLPTQTGSDSARAAEWERVARESRAELDTTRTLFDGAIARIRADSGRIAAIRDSTTKLDARPQAAILGLTIERDSLLELIADAPVGERRCRSSGFPAPRSSPAMAGSCSMSPTSPVGSG